MHSCGLAYSRLTVIVRTSGAVPVAHGEAASADALAVFHRVLAGRACGSGPKDDRADNDPEQLRHVSLLPAGAFCAAPHTACKPSSDSVRLAPHAGAFKRFAHHGPAGGILDVFGAAAGGRFSTTKPDASRCCTNRSAVIRAIMSSA
jgi:hypothetical protein